MEISEYKLQEQNDRHFMLGQRAALMQQMRSVLKELLGYDDDFTKERMILEREETIYALRAICMNHGDNDWEETLHMADIINKHLGNYLDEPKPENKPTKEQLDKFMTWLVEHWAPNQLRIPFVDVAAEAYLKLEHKPKPIINKEELIKNLCEKKANGNNFIDLNAYAVGLSDMFDQLNLDKTTTP